MAWFRKVKAGLVKSEITEYVGEEGNIFFNIETGECRLSDGITPFGLPCGSGSGGLTAEDVELIIAQQIENGQLAVPTVEAEQRVENVTGHITSVPTPVDLKPGSQEIYLNGIRLNEGTANDYAIDPSTIDFLNGWKLFNNDVINIVYEIDS